MPTGIQKLLPARIMGTTPTAVVAVVRKMGTMRRLPASRAASLADMPSAIFSLACSKMSISLRIIMPMRVMKPNMPVRPSTLLAMSRPMMAPGMPRLMATMHTMAMENLRKLNSRKKKMSTMAMAMLTITSGVVSLFFSVSPPTSARTP